jgi:uncharacterized protein (TIGR03000 family)
MYSVVLATMLTVGGANAPSSCFGCHGCHGCYSCYSCHGCYGCYGYAFSSCYGCYGCSGCYGCYGGCHGCYSSCYGCYGSCYGCYGCHGCYGCYGAAVYYMPATVVVGREVIPGPGKGSTDAAQREIQMLKEQLEKAQKELQKYKGKDEQTSSVSQKQAAPAKVTVRLPADAKLFVDNIACPLTSGTRQFQTPNLTPNKKFFYDLRVEVVRDGQTVSQTQRVVVEAGQDVTATFANMTPAVATGTEQ